MPFPLAMLHTIDAICKGLNTYTAYAILSFFLFPNVVITRENDKEAPFACANRGFWVPEFQMFHRPSNGSF